MARKQVFNTRPPEPMQLLALLQEIFPGFGSAPGLIEEIEASGDTGLHCIMREFCGYFPPGKVQPSEDQLRSLADLLDEAVAVDDKLENAVSTCFLEHTRQTSCYKMLAPHVSARVKARTRA